MKTQFYDNVAYCIIYMHVGIIDVCPILKVLEPS